MRTGDWIVSGGRYLRRVTAAEMKERYIRKVVKGAIVIELRKGHVHPWLTPKPPKQGFIARMLGLKPQAS
jgi:hypothetical protein